MNLQIDYSRRLSWIIVTGSIISFSATAYYFEKWISKKAGSLKGYCVLCITIIVISAGVLLTAILGKGTPTFVSCNMDTWNADTFITIHNA